MWRTQGEHKKTTEKHIANTHTERKKEKITAKQKNNMQMRLYSILSGAKPKVKVQVQVKVQVELEVNVLMSLQLQQMLLIIMHASLVGGKIFINNSNLK